MARHDRSAAAVPAAVAGVFTVLFLGLGHALWAQAPTPTPTATPSVSVADPGRFLFERDCAWCHGTNGEGTDRGPSLMGTGAAASDFQLSTGRMPLPSVDAQAERRPPAYAPAQIDQINGYVASLGAGPEIPAVDPAAGNLQEGAALYQANCAACHSSTAAGGALTNGQRAPSLRLSTPVQVGEAVRLGPGTMPAFGPGTISSEQLDSISRYLGYIQHPPDRGGAGLGHLGPVSEGFIGLAAGLGLLLLVVRWIGTKG
jgi:ubiquinol-cytochrome c reductase cytochrome c subunit